MRFAMVAAQIAGAPLAVAEAQAKFYIAFLRTPAAARISMAQWWCARSS
jgi:hypothetical protein